MIYCVIEFDYDGQYSDVYVYATSGQAADKFAEIYSRGGEAKIELKELK